MLPNILFALGLLVDKYFIWNSFIKKTKDPMRLQFEVLKNILKSNAQTAYGKEHNFSSIKGYEDYKNVLHIQTYEDIRSYVDKQIATGEPYLTQEKPVLFAQTSGTTGKAKLIPILKSSIRAHKWSQRIFLYPQHIAYPKMYSGKVLVIASPAIEGYLENGTPYGSMSGLIYKEMPWFIKGKFVLPPEVFNISDYDLKYLVIAAFSLAASRITNMVSANPSTFLKLLDVINERHLDIIEAVRTGSLEHIQGFTESERTMCKRYLQKNKSRAEQLENIFKIHPRVTYEHLFTDLETVCTWTAGSCGTLIPILRQNISHRVHIVEVGYLASEFRGSLNIDVKNNRCIPAIHETFLEFAPRDEYERGEVKLKTLGDVEVGKQYYIFITTKQGMYRYDMNDIIEVTGHFNKTPTIVFIQKGKGVTNITGEKLYESQVIQAVGNIRTDIMKNVTFFIMLADEKNLQYSLYIEGEIKGTEEHIAKFIEGELMAQNIEYEAKRKSGRLLPLQVVLLELGTGEKYKKSVLAQGLRESQYKPQPLVYAHELKFNIKDCILKTV